ncbi:uncharacterized protein PGTG_18641 [Puccinia graminis f. sp. tritici CRL 75-36-700-3]|uniref:Uncharacterized protein n=1 Tax=Puccinia graminis f. sp. tritici (strain CRL 75-36-700-3 / race SCCL) TaxID=418459 RepID=E3L882_PUCGT|nr:uncharacterized protein PGTG_18641 [Puccinia graminis f. sp. tritici CRL 75-36-700-3]EFP92757.2 hypothetical protein PGTG_18641 [Puccinia graminis f. sp. tritici CRL 75-36-700-3]
MAGKSSRTSASARISGCQSTISTPDWPKLKASMIAYWGNVNTAKFTLHDPEPPDRLLEDKNPRNLERGVRLKKWM